MAEERHNKHGRDMTRGSIPHHLLVFSIPMLFGNVIQAAYSIVNAIWVGRGLGETALAAVTVSMPIMFLLIAIGIGITMGTGILVAQFAGAKEWDRLRTSIGTSVVMLCGLCVILLSAGQMFTPWIIKQLQTPANVYALAVSYMRIFLCSMPFSFGTFLSVAMLRGVGDSKTPLYFQTGSLIGTAILDPILMFGWIGFPRMGVNGTAVASVTMQGVGMVACYIYLHHKEHIVAPQWRRLRVDWPMLWLILKIGLPSVVQQSLVSLGMLFVTGIISRFGENSIAAFGAAMRIDQIAFLPAMTFGAAVSTLVGQNIGANRVGRVKEVFRWGIILCGGITLLMTTVLVTIPHIVLKMFLTDGPALRIGVHYLHIMGVAYLSFALWFVANGVINGAGYTFVTTIISLFSLWIARVPLAIYLSHRMHRVEGVFIAMAVSAVTSMLISQVCYYSGSWKKPIIHHRQEPELIEVIE